MKKCSKCGRDITLNCKTCVHCGFNPSSLGSKLWIFSTVFHLFLFIVITFIVIILIGMLILYIFYY